MTALIASEWIKIRSVRSTIWTLALTMLLCVGLAYLLGMSWRAAQPDLEPELQERFDPLFATFYSIMIGQLALVVFAVFVVTSEFSTGTIRGSLAATPLRGRFVAAKTAAGALVTAVVAVVSVAGAFFAAQAGLGSMGVSIGSPGALEAAVGACLYLVLMYLFVSGVAMLLRGAIPTLGILMPVLFLGSQGLGNVPKVKTVAQYLPDQAGSMIMHIVGPPGDSQFGRPYGPWAGLGIMALWAVAALLAGYVAIRRRDA